MMFMPNGPGPGPNGNGPPQMNGNHPPMMMPPGHPQHQPQPGQPGQPGGPPLPPPQRSSQPPSPNPAALAGRIIYPPNQPIIINPHNPHAPPIHPCGACRREAQADCEEVLKCESGCNFFFHRICVGLTPESYAMLCREPYAEWVCENCYHNRGIPPIKFKNY